MHKIYQQTRQTNMFVLLFSLVLICFGTYVDFLIGFRCICREKIMDQGLFNVTYVKILSDNLKGGITLKWRLQLLPVIIRTSTD